jgi:acyl-[acyl-carrier-protein]-phospholipid O-acyltransferase/long-chain-fatty-acid--[acyl-carrier-protein] ligase
MALINSRAFLPLFITQFLGAFNDNLLKNSIVILITFKIAYETDINAKLLVTVAAGIFILPFFLFSASAGQFADKYERTFIVKLVKISETIVAILGGMALYYHQPWFLIALLFASGVDSTFFGPIKFALLPQLLHDKQLIAANAYFSAGTFVAILLGTICGGVLILRDHGTVIVAIIMIAVAIMGFTSCLFIPTSPGPDPKLRISHNVFRETWRIIAYSRLNMKVFIAILAISWFWFIGATFLSQVPNYVKEIMHAESKVVTIFFTAFTIGIGIGSFLCDKILRGNITTTLVPYTIIGMSMFIIDLYFASQAQAYHNLSGLLPWQNFLHMNASLRIIIDLMLIAVCGGMYIVPLYALMQTKSPTLYLARIVAANNVLNSLFMVIAALFTIGMLIPERTIPEIFLAIGILNIPIGLVLHHYMTRIAK